MYEKRHVSTRTFAEQYRSFINVILSVNTKTAFPPDLLVFLFSFL